MKKRFVFAITLFILLSTFKPEIIFSKNKFNIKEIEIDNNLILKSNDLKKDLIFIYDENLVFLNTHNIDKILKNFSFIDSYEIKKIYPNKLKIKIYEKKPIAILHKKKEKFYISEKIELINFINLENYKDLPIVIGNEEYFKELYKNLKKMNFPLEIIKKYYSYETRRWDIEIYNKIIIKLPPRNYIKSLKNFMKLRNENNFDKYKVFDYRINNQLILK